MAHLTISENDTLYYEYDPPADERPTFVFVNALTGSTAHWQGAIGDTLRAAGIGVLAYNFRGQADSAFSPSLELGQELIVADLRRLVDEIAPPDPIVCGLSIGGLFAANAILAGMPAKGLVLLNTLRRAGPRIDWVNHAMLGAVKAGGFELLLDMYFPLLVNEDFAAGARETVFRGGGYQPLDPAHGHFKLMEASTGTGWDLDYAALALPTLVISGLKDRVFYEAEDVERLYALLPDARRTDWPDAGHLLPVEFPRRLADALVEFADDIA